MEDKLSTTCQLDLARRDFLKGLALAGAAMALPSVAAAAETNVITGYGVTTAQLKDWSIMENIGYCEDRFRYNYGKKVFKGTVDWQSPEQAVGGR